MKNQEEIYHWLRERLLERYSLAKNITRSSRIYHDLGLRGMDASEFLDETFKRYGVSWDGFDFRAYFKGEYYSPIDFLNWLLGRQDTTKKPLTVGHLVDVCTKGHWVDPIQ